MGRGLTVLWLLPVLLRRRTNRDRGDALTGRKRGGKRSLRNLNIGSCTFSAPDEGPFAKALKIIKEFVSLVAFDLSHGQADADDYR